MLTYTQAKMIIWNPKAYSDNKVREAASEMLVSFNASQEDIDQAALLI